MTTPVSIPVDNIFSALDDILANVVTHHGDEAKAFAWDIRAELLARWSHLRGFTYLQPLEDE